MSLKKTIKQYPLISYMCLTILKKKAMHIYKSKHNLKRKNQVIPLMITDGEKWHYLAVKNYQHYLEE